MRGGQRQCPFGAIVLALAMALPCITALAQAGTHSADALAGLDSPTLVAARRIIDDARHRGLPGEPLLSKVREGTLKRASPPRIAAAVAALAMRLDSSRASLGSQASASELIAGADALASGASPDALRVIRDATASHPISVPLGVLAQLVASGVPTNRAVAIVVEMLHRNVTPLQQLAYGNAVEGDAASGVPAEESAVFRLRSIEGADGRGARALDINTVLTSPVNGALPRSDGAPRRRP